MKRTSLKMIDLELICAEWILDKCPITTNNMTIEEQECEQHFQTTTVHGEDGKYTVSIPLRTDQSVLGVSKQRAAARFLQLERQFAKNEKLKKEYGKLNINTYSNFASLEHYKQIRSNSRMCAQNIPVFTAYNKPML